MTARPSYKLTFFDRHGPDGALRMRAAAYAFGVGALLGTELGGRLEVGRAPGGGTRARIDVPLDQDGR